MPSEKAPYTSLLKDESKTSLGALDLFDRVINLKLTTRNGDEYVIRSDYEIYYPDFTQSIASNDADNILNAKKCYIRKCQYKPSIKIQYKRVSMTTPVSVDIFINNFFMLDKNGKVLRNFNNMTNQLRKVDVEIGYFGQFKSAMKASKASELTVSQLFDFNPDNLKGHGITVLSMSDVEYVQTDKLPPDMTVHIHGYVGNLFAPSLVTEDNSVPSNFEELKKGKNNIFINPNNIPKGEDAFDFDSILGQLLFNLVTKQFSRTADIPDDVSVPFSDEDAKKYGVIVYMSKSTKESAKAIDLIWDSVDEVAVNITDTPNAISRVNAIMSALGYTGDRRFNVTPISTTGNILIYHAEEVEGSIAEVLESTSLKKVYDQEAPALYWQNKLPAVYNITTDALCTITCPFFFFVNPFQKFYFKSAYALGGLVAYYANFSPQEDEFYALWQTISFATVEDVNECTIVCTGKKSSS